MQNVQPKSIQSVLLFNKLLRDRVQRIGIRISATWRGTQAVRLKTDSKQRWLHYTHSCDGGEEEEFWPRGGVNKVCWRGTKQEAWLPQRPERRTAACGLGAGGLERKETRSQPRCCTPVNNVWRPVISDRPLWTFPVWLPHSSMGEWHNTLPSESIPGDLLSNSHDWCNDPISDRKVWII